jgi:hypothetical protein
MICHNLIVNKRKMNGERGKIMFTGNRVQWDRLVEASTAQQLKRMDETSVRECGGSVRVSIDAYYEPYSNDHNTEIIYRCDNCKSRSEGPVTFDNLEAYLQNIVDGLP